MKTGIQISSNAKIGKGLLLPHYSCIVIGSVEIGDNCVIFQGVTLGYAGRCNKGGSPIIGNNCVLGAGCKICGKIKVGDNVFIGSNAVIAKNVPDNAVVAAQLGQIISYNGTKGYFGN